MVFETFLSLIFRIYWLLKIIFSLLLIGYHVTHCGFIMYDFPFFSESAKIETSISTSIIIVSSSFYFMSSSIVSTREWNKSSIGFATFKSKFKPGMGVTFLLRNPKDWYQSVCFGDWFMVGKQYYSE